jgi:Mce-associated membrane protein
LDSRVNEASSTSARGLRWVVLLLTVALVAALVALGLVVRDLRHERDLRTAGEQADKAARAAVVAMTTYDYQHVEDDFGWVDSAGTASFRKRYAEISAPIKKLVVQLKAKASGTVIASAPRVESTDHVEVLLFVDQQITNPGESKPSIDQPRVTMSMVKRDGRWLVDDVELKSLTGAK